MDKSKFHEIRINIMMRNFHRQVEGIYAEWIKGLNTEVVLENRHFEVNQTVGKLCRPCFERAMRQQSPARVYHYILPKNKTRATY